MSRLSTVAIIAALLLVCGWTWLFKSGSPGYSAIFHILGFCMALRAQCLYSQGEDF